MSNRLQWIIWLTATAGLVGYLTYCLSSQPSATAGTFLPGVTTHGHYQIELQCSACHTPGMGVQQDACVKCHGEDLDRSIDTHPKSKFTDPGKAHLVKRLDGRYCVTCHREHVPDQTAAMGLSLPGDYCWHCHQEIGQQRPSHQDLAYDSCATAGCHNYHDNRALYESFLVSHYGESDMLETQVIPPRHFAAVWAAEHPEQRPLHAEDQDAPASTPVEPATLDDWAATAHAAAGVNCSDCHTTADGPWRDKLTHEACQTCHQGEVEGFLEGRHGMRLAAGLRPMSPAEARLPMNHDSFHRELTCVACHSDHRFDTQFAAAEACLQCHNDRHSLAYRDSSHYELWKQELAGAAAPGTGVSCATCHLPREKDAAGRVVVQHNPNDNLRPNEKMIRSVCNNCHGLQFSLDSLADRELIERNFAGSPSGRVDSIDMAKAWSDERERLKQERRRKRAERKRAQAANSQPAGD